MKDSELRQESTLYGERSLSHISSAAIVHKSALYLSPARLGIHNRQTIGSKPCEAAQWRGSQIQNATRWLKNLHSSDLLVSKLGILEVQATMYRIPIAALLLLLANILVSLSAGPLAALRCDQQSSDQGRSNSLGPRLNFSETALDVASTIPSSRSTMQERESLALGGRSTPRLAGLIYRFYEVYVVEPVSKEKKIILEETHKAFLSHLKTSEELWADRPPFTNLTLGYGQLQLILNCPNPLHYDVVVGILDLLLMMSKMNWPTFYRLGIWGVQGVAILVIFRNIPTTSAPALIG